MAKYKGIMPSFFIPLFIVIVSCAETDEVVAPTETTAATNTTTPAPAPACKIGKCCQDGAFKKNVICEYSTSECLADAVCDGNSSECPALEKKPDGTACKNGSCMNGYCVSKVCFGDCCDTNTNALAKDETPCGYYKKGKCYAGVCVIGEEFTPEYIAKQQTKEKAYQDLIEKVLVNNEANAVKKAARWFNSIKRNLKKQNKK